MAVPTIPADEPPALARTTTGASYHASESLRRMITHETGRGVEVSRDGPDGLDTHDEHEHEHEHELDHELNQESEVHDSASHDHDEEKRIEGDGQGASKKQRKTVELQDQTNLLPKKQVFIVFAGLSVALVCALLDQTIVTTALPTLGRVFNRADISSWVGTAYLLTSTAMQPLYGRLSDIFGRKWCLLGALTVFLIGSIACAVAQSMIQLIVFRAIQGLGGGGILTLAMIIISDIVSLKDRGKYQGVIGVVVAASNSSGPLLGGAFTQKVSWRWCFYINIPLTVIALIIVAIALPLRRVKGSITGKLKKVDWFGSALTLGWATLVLIALSWAGSQYAWDSAGVLAPLLIGLALLGVFLFVELRLVALPLIPIGIFRNITVATCMLSTFLMGCAFYACLYYLPIYFQVVRGASPIRSGVLLLPLIIVQTFVSFTSGVIQSRTGDYYFNIVFGFSIWSIGLGLLSTLTPTTSYAHLAGYMALAGIGSGQTFQTSLVAIQASVERKDMATATAARNFLRMLGGTIALAVCSTIINNVVSSELRNLDVSAGTVHRIISSPDALSDLDLSAAQRTAVIYAYAKGIRGVFYFLIPCVALSAIISAIFVKRVPLKRGDDAEKKAEAKQWLAEKKERHAKKHGASSPEDLHDEPRPSTTTAGDAQAPSGEPGDGPDSGKSTLSRIAHQAEAVVEEAGREVAEGGGVAPPKNDSPIRST